MSCANLGRILQRARGPPLSVARKYDLPAACSDSAAFNSSSFNGLFQMKDFDGRCKPTRPVLRYHGGKWRIAPWVISFFPPHETYVEPFGGGGSVLLRKPESRNEVYNDLDEELCNLFRMLRSRGNQLVKLLKLTPFSRTEFERCFQPGGSNLERARKAMFRSICGFGTAGYFRQTGFSTSIKNRNCRSHEWANYPDALAKVVERLKCVVIENRPAIDVMQRNDSETTLHYVDPPYVATTRSSPKDYRYEMDDAQHIELAECLHSLKGTVVLSGYPSPLYSRLFKSLKTHDRMTTTQTNERRVERIWIKAARS